MTFEQPGDASQCLVLEACLKVSTSYSLPAYANVGKDYDAFPVALWSTNYSSGEPAVVLALCVSRESRWLVVYRQPANVMPSELVVQVPPQLKGDDCLPGLAFLTNKLPVGVKGCCC